MNVYDASDRQWHQHWVENTGFFPLRLDGAFRNGAMVMQESYPDPYGSPTVYTDRYTWTRLGRDECASSPNSRPTGVSRSYRPSTATITGKRIPLVPNAAVFTNCTSSDPGLSLFQEFNFTVGEWNVEFDGPGMGAAASHRHRVQSNITTDLDGCLIEEKLTGPQGYEARVFTNIRPIDEIWRRTYVDNQGLRVYLTGPRIHDGKIVLSGTMPKLGGGTRQVRATFEQVGPNRFVQRWTREDRHGWTTLVTARYTRR